MKFDCNNYKGVLFPMQGNYVKKRNSKLLISTVYFLKIKNEKQFIWEYKTKKSVNDTLHCKKEYL